MSLSDKETLELHELLDGLVENNLSPSRKAKLENWMAESEEVRKGTSTSWTCPPASFTTRMSG